MTVSTTLDRQEFPGDGSNKLFPFNFRFFDNSQIYVYVVLADGSMLGRTIGDDYTLSGANSAYGGQVTMGIAPAVGQKLLVRRILPLVQPTSVRNQGAFFPAVHEDAFDRLTMLLQQLNGEIGQLTGLQFADNIIALATLVGRADTFPYFTTANSFGLADLTPLARVFLAASTRAQQAAALGSRAISAEIFSPLTNDDGFVFGYTNPGATINGNGNGFNYYQLKVVSDQAVQQIGLNGATGSKVNGLNVSLNFGGPNTRGGRHGILGQCLQGFGQGGATSAGNGDRNYCGVQGLCFTDSGDGGTGPGDVRGAYFGGSSFGAVLGGAYVANLTGHEFNTQINAGTGPSAGVRVAIHTGIQVASLIGERGYGLDACFSGSNLGGSTYGWKYGMAFHGANGRAAFDADSTVLKVFTTASATATIDTLIDITGVSSSAILRSTKLVITDQGINYNTPAAFFNMGGATASTVQQTFRSSGLNATYDARFSFTGGSAATGNGVITVEANGVITPLIRPGTDNASSLGLSSFRWSVVYAGTGTINTSDAREKTPVRKLSAAELSAAAELASEIGIYQWLSSVQEKGDDARLHVGQTVQRAREIMESHGLDPMAYGFICYDKWEATEAVVAKQEDGTLETVQPATEAGDRYGFRMDELNAFIAAGLKASFENQIAEIKSDFEARLSALEAKK